MCETCEKIERVDAHATGPIRLKCVDEKAARLLVELMGRIDALPKCSTATPTRS